MDPQEQLFIQEMVAISNKQLNPPQEDFGKSLSQDIYLAVVKKLERLQNRIKEFLPDFTYLSANQENTDREKAVLNISKILFEAFEKAANAFYDDQDDALFLLKRAETLQGQVQNDYLEESAQLLQRLAVTLPVQKGDLEQYKKQITNSLTELRQKSIAEQAIFRELILQLQERNETQGLPPPMDIQQQVQDLQDHGDEVMLQINTELEDFFNFVEIQLADFAAKVEVPLNNYFTKNRELINMVKGADAQKYYESHLYNELKKAIDTRTPAQRPTTIETLLNETLIKVQNERSLLPVQSQDPILQGAMSMLDARATYLQRVIQKFQTNPAGFIITVESFQRRRI